MSVSEKSDRQKLYKDILREVIYKINQEEYLNLSNEKFTYPIDDEVVINELKGDQNLARAKDYFINSMTNGNIKLKKESKKIISQYTVFKESIKNLSFNPKKEYIPKQFFENNKINMKSMDLIFELLNNKGAIRTNLYFMGEKGCGKTLTQNVWLEKNNRELENNKVFWVRCDAHKLYNLWKDKKGNFKEEYLISIDDYISLQFLYVFAKYSFFDNREFFKIALSIIENAEEEVVYKKSKNNDSDEESEKHSVLKKFLELVNIIKLRENYSKKEKNYKGQVDKKNYSYMLDEIMYNGQTENRRAIINLKRLSKKIQEILVKEKYKFLFIVDGIDNIELSRKVGSQQLYTHMVNQVGDFIEDEFNSNFVKVAFGREKTFKDIFYSTGIRQSVPDGNPPEVIFFKFVALQKIIVKRYEYLRKLTSFRKSRTIFARVIRKIYNNKKIFTNIEPYKNSESYHNNARSFLYNICELAMLISFRYYQIPSRRRISFNVQDHLNKYLIRNRYLNGYLYLDYKINAADIEEKMGKYMFNIFHFESKNLWEGLCTTRILQYLMKYNIESENKLINIMKEDFSYSEVNIIDSIEKLRNFGAIDTVLDTSKFELEYRINKKGIYAYKEIFSEIDVLYILALDTQFPECFFENNFVKAHNNSLNVITGYYTSVFATIVSFIIFIICMEKREKKKYSNTKINYSSVYSLPFNDKKLKHGLFKNLTKAFEKSEVEESLNFLALVKETLSNKISEV